MPAVSLLPEALFVEELLNPVPVDGMPAGMDMRWTPEWDRLKEARRFDDDLQTGKWQKRERKTADWRSVRDMAAALLRERTKDLQVAMWFTEASVRLSGFSGLRDGFRIARELIERYWSQGLFPALEDGPEDRSGPFEWLNDKLVDSIRAIPITARRDGTDRDYGLIDLEDARRVGSEKSCLNSEGEIDPVRRRAYDQALAAGHVSLEMFDRAVIETGREGFEELARTFQQAFEQFSALEKSVDEHFGDVAPNLAGCRNVMRDIDQAVSDMSGRLPRQPDLGRDVPLDIAVLSHPPLNVNGQAVTPPTEISPPPMSVRADFAKLQNPPPVSRSEPVISSEGRWEDAENLIRSGQMEKGLAAMSVLAATETTGRSRFLRKLLLAQACLDIQRDSLARSILEELAEQIDKFQLDHWESSELIATVWTRLSRLYKLSDDSDLQDRAKQYFERLCRLDPWQALKAQSGIKAGASS